VQTSGLSTIENLRGDSDEDTELLRRMADEALLFLNQFDWCKEIREFYFGLGIGGVLAVFLARILPSQKRVDEWLWVVVGDLPPAYLVTDAASTPVAALRGYIEEMRKWVAAVWAGKSLDNVIPVNAPATLQNADALCSRLNHIERELIPEFES
jgi:hypothetical protein